MTDTVTLVRADGSHVWHVLATEDEWSHALCGFRFHPAAREERLDPHVVSHKGKPVCANCRSVL